MRALILSAGFGKRLLPHTSILAKPAIPFLGLPGLCYPLFLAESVGLSKVVFNLHHLPKTIEAAARNHVRDHYETVFLEERPVILDSAGGIKNAQAPLRGEGHFMTLNGDTICLFDRPNPLSGMVHAHVQSGALATLLVQKHQNAGHTHGGVFVKNRGSVVSHFAKTRDGSVGEPYHFLGVALYADRVFDLIPKNQPLNIFYDTLTLALSKGEAVIVHEAPMAMWFETGNEEDFLAAASECLGEYKKQSPHGVFLHSILQRFRPELASLSPSKLGRIANPFPIL
jgi:NDP-sugar pyrophosphorylase family protein